MVSRFLLLLALSCCVCGLEVNVAHSSYQAEEKQSLTLEWTFTPKPDPSLKRLLVYCDMIKESKVSVLFRLHEGVEISESQSEEFSGRVQCDKDVLREGRIRLHVSSLRTEDSGLYWCEVRTDSGLSSDRCRLRVSAAVDEPETQRPPERPEPGAQSRGRIALYMGLSASASAFLCLCVFSLCEKKRDPKKRNQSAEVPELTERSESELKVCCCREENEPP